MIVNVEGFMSVDGDLWAMTIEVIVPQDLSSDEKVAHIKATIKGFKTRGIVSSVPGEPPSSPRSDRPAGQATGQAGKAGAAFTWPAPQCPTHGIPMKVSTVQKDDNLVAYFCTSKIDGEYCKTRASVTKSNGSIITKEIS